MKQADEAQKHNLWTEAEIILDGLTVQQGQLLCPRPGVVAKKQTVVILQER